jgi:hypothetical protein
MPDPSTPSSVKPSTAPSTSPATPKPAIPAGPTINIGEEFGTAKRNLPPAKIVIICVAAVAIVILVASFLKRAKPQAAGSLDNVVAVDITGQGSTMVALTFTLTNTSDKILYVHSLQGKIKTASGDSTADAVSAVDFDRYYAAFPVLKNRAQPALSPEAKIQPGESVVRTIIVAFPMTLDAFNQRQSTSVVVWPYDQQLPVVLSR